jgi:hypothetical protein
MHKADIQVARRPGLRRYAAELGRLRRAGTGKRSRRTIIKIDTEACPHGQRAGSVDAFPHARNWPESLPKRTGRS